MSILGRLWHVIEEVSDVDDEEDEIEEAGDVDDLEDEENVSDVDDVENEEENIPPAPERPPQRVPENYQSDWYYELTDNMVNALRPGDLLQFRRRKCGVRYCHWAIYIGPFKHNTKNGEVVLKSAVSHLHGKKGKKDKPKHYCPEGGCCIYSKYRPASLSEMKHEVSKSEGWRINNATITGYFKKDRLTISIMALAAARHGSSPAAQDSAFIWQWDTFQDGFLTKLKRKSCPSSSSPLYTFFLILVNEKKN
ncbi:uncharacterized protein LOC136043620 [Artemia franciscana]|uniref:uncharacterized protein LOC136043620 n=1 Tax=Artemia franciscana TaxID=6661 RepID=UPI0032DB0A45